MIVWRTNPLELLKEHGYSTYRIRKENLFNETTVQNLRHEKSISFKDLDEICRLTGKPVSKLIKYVKD